MAKHVLTLALLLLVPASSAAQAPSELQSWSSWGVTKLKMGPGGSIYVTREDQGVTAYDSEGNALQTWPVKDLVEAAVAPDGELFAARRKTGYSPDIQRIGPDGGLIAEWTSRLTPTEGSAGVRGIAVGPDDLVYVLDENFHRVAKFSRDGQPVDHWDTYYDGAGPGEHSCLTIDADGNVILGAYSFSGYGRIKIYDPDGTLLWARTEVLGDGRSFYPTDVDRDRWGNFYVADDTHELVIVYKADGNLLGRYASKCVYTSGITVDAQGNVYVADNSKYLIRKFAPFGPAFTPVEQAAVMLHVRPAESLDDPCAGAPQSVDDIVTEGKGDPAKGGNYYVYVLGSPEKYIASQSAGINGFQFGIEYHQVGGQSEQAVRVHEWTQCAGLEFPQDAWPGSGSGNTVTWAIGECQEGEITTAGYFYLSAYSPSRMWVVAFPPTGKVKVANCLGAELEAQAALSPIRLGWVSLEETGGCNPLLEPCYGPTPVQRSTWGSLKARFSTAGGTSGSGN
jgi:sugar lactone lactonase YvrE